MNIRKKYPLDKNSRISIRSSNEDPRMIIEVPYFLIAQIEKAYWQRHQTNKDTSGEIPEKDTSGNLHQYSGDDSASAKKLQSIYGDMWEIYKGPIRTIWLARNDLFEKVFSPSTKNAFLIRALPNSGLEEFNTTKIGMTFNSDLKEWSYNRKFMNRAIMSPNFIKEVVEGTQDIFSDMENCWQNLRKNHEKSDKIVNIQKWILLATSESIIYLTSHRRAYSVINYYNKLSPTEKFDIPVGALEESENYIANIRTYIRAMEFFFTTPKFIRILPGVRQYAQSLINNRDLLYKFLTQIIQERREEIEKASNKKTLSSDLLTLFLTTNTSHDISNERVVKELETIFGRDPNYRFTAEDLAKLSYCEAVIKEEAQFAQTQQQCEDAHDYDEIIINPIYEDQEVCQIKSNVLDEHTIERNLILKRKRQNLREGFLTPLNKVRIFETGYNSDPELYNGEYSLSDSKIFIIMISYR
ncbi:447_t:CDS:2 [Scutellospora calospora]|uniref:447_t:CDS:1 n=1 Tax=Scutellospora calospora TaxID=85575 RepID=A0ACA9K094_9GLOM|nr:447_t:CDS:2 [Scutellospora calospora]